MAYTLLSALLLVSLLSTVEAAAGDHNQACAASPSYCTGAGATNDVCDTKRATSLCKTKATFDCTVNDDCVAGSSCSGLKCQACDSTSSDAAGDLCAPKAGYLGGSCGTCTAANTECSSSKCACKTGYTAVYSTFSCLPNLGYACNVNDGCYDTTNVCDPATLLCKLKDGASCASPNGDKCTTGATCSTGATTTCSCAAATTVVATAGYCQKKIDAGATCNWYDTCSDATTVCDRQLGKCVKKENSDCSASDTCTTGAQCTSSKCTCSSAIGLAAASGYCKANTAGKPGGLCSAGACTDANAECKAMFYGSVGDKFCLCKTNSQFKIADGSCSTPSSASGLYKMSGFITVIAALYLGFHL